MAKKIAVVVSGAPEQDRLREVTIEPGTRAIDILNGMGLHNYMLSRDGSGEFYANEEEVYATVEDGAKLRATSRATVGGFWRSLWAAFVGLPAEDGAPPPVRQTARPAAGKVCVHSPPVSQSSRGTHIRADSRPLWQLRGWRQVSSEKLVGAFRVPKVGSYAGEILLTRGRPDYFLLSPPKSLLRSSHGPCFRVREPGKYWVHFSQASSDIDSGLVAVEGLLAEALKKGR
jgi:hypothetical protein